MNFLTLRSQSIPHRLTAQISSGLGIVFSTYIFTTALIILHLRSWDTVILKQIAVFSSYPLMLFGLVSIAMCLIGTPWIYLGILPAATLLFMGLPFVFNQLGLWLVFSLALLGISLITFSALLAYGKTIWPNLLWLLCSGIVIASFYFIIVNGKDDAHIFSDVASYVKSLTSDTLFHSSIINMLARFSTPSTGLDGVTPLAYHVGVHRWILAFKVLAPGSTPLLLAMGLQIGLLPVLFFAWTLTIGLLLQGSINLLSLLAWAFGSLIVVSSLLWEQHLVSESYAFSLPVFLAMIPIAQTWVLTDRSNGRPSRFWLLILATVAFIACIVAKISTGVILAIFLIACLLLPRLLKTDRRSLFLYGGLGLLLCAFCLGLAYFFILGAPPLKLSPFHSARYYPKQAITESQIAMICLWIFYAWGRQGSSDSWKHQTLTLVLAVTYTASLVPGLLLEIGGNSAFFFSHPAFLILLLFGLVGLINRWNSLDTKAYLSRLWSRPWSKTTLGACVIAWFVVAQLLLFLLTNYPIPGFLGFADQSTRYLKYLSLFDQNRLVASDLITATRNLRIRDRLKLLWAPPVIDLARLQSLSALYRIEQAVDSAGIVPTTVDTLVYISPDFDEFWSLEESGIPGSIRPGDRWHCWDKSFQIPAVLGLPLLNGVRGAINDCDNTPYYGMADYDSDSLNIDLSDEAVCDKAQDLGFSKVFTVNRDSQYLIHCSRQ